MARYNALIHCNLECCIGCVNFSRSDSYCSVHKTTVKYPWSTQCGDYKW